MCDNLLRTGLMIAIILVGCLVGAGEEFDRADAKVTAVQQTSPNFMVHAAVNHQSRDYREDDTFRMRVKSERDAYIYVIYQQADGKTYQVFPNVAQKNNRVKAREVLLIPAEDDQFRWRISGPFGTETVKVIASEEPLENLSDAQMRSKRFNPVSQRQLKQITETLVPEDETALDAVPDAESPNWAETELTVTTYARDHEAESSGKKRFAIFFGVSAYEFSDQERLVTERGMNLSSPEKDALVLNQIMSEIGDIDDSRVFINDGATRENLEQAVTQWLPQQSKPGDTVFIYFSGHGGQIDDDGGDEQDKKDEFLCPYDFLSIAGLIGLIKQEEAGVLPEKYKDLIPQAKKLIANSGSAEKANERLVRRSGVTDDLFGHWLQALSDRQVVVILDICHSGGFANEEKGIIAGRFPSRIRRRDRLKPPKADSEVVTAAGASAVDESKQGREFGFLDQQLGRLKDIGQGNTALLTASTTSELSLVRPDGNLSVMTHELIEAIRNARGPLDLDDTFSQVTSRCEAFFASEEFRNLQEKRGPENKPLPHHPLLFNNTSDRIWLKP